MIESREVSQLTRIALAALTKLHQQQIEELAQAASVVEQAPLAEGWLLDLATLRWTRDVPGAEGAA